MGATANCTRVKMKKNKNKIMQKNKNYETDKNVMAEGVQVRVVNTEVHSTCFAVVGFHAQKTAT